MVLLIVTGKITLRMIDPKVTARCWKLFHITEPDSLLGYRLKQNIDYVNSTSFLRLKHKNNIPVYYKHDAHWTPKVIKLFPGSYLTIS